MLSPPLPLSWNNYMFRLNYPSFRLLLYLEWLLLVTAILMEVVLPFYLSWSLFLEVIAIATFGLMGLQLPTGALGTKLVYTTLEVALILLPANQLGLSTRSVLLMSLVLVMRSCLIFNRFGQFSVLGLSLFSYATLILTKPIVQEKFNKLAIWDWRLSNILVFSLTLIFALLLINALLAERKSREQLEIAHQQLREYALRIEDQATLQERNRIAREIHDGLGHTLAAQTIQINNALLFWQSDNDKAKKFVEQAKQLAAEALLEIRRSLSLLRSNPLQGESLKSALDKLLTEFQQTTAIEPCFELSLPFSLPTEVNTAIYRLVQESLTNICKHAEATKVSVKLLSDDKAVHLSIEDNGKGFNINQNTTGFGLQGMRERAIALGAQLNIYTQPKAGCCICVSLALSKLLL